MIYRAASRRASSPERNTIFSSSRFAEKLKGQDRSKLEACSLTDPEVRRRSKSRVLDCEKTLLESRNFP